MTRCDDGVRSWAVREDAYLLCLREQNARFEQALAEHDIHHDTMKDDSLGDEE